MLSSQSQVSVYYWWNTFWCAACSKSQIKTKKERARMRLEELATPAGSFFPRYAASRCPLLFPNGQDRQLFRQSRRGAGSIAEDACPPSLWYGRVPTNQWLLLNLHCIHYYKSSMKSSTWPSSASGSLSSYWLIPCPRSAGKPLIPKTTTN